MLLTEFIAKKEEELKLKYKKVTFNSAQNVMLMRNSTASQFNSEETSLLQMGKEVELHELEKRSSDSSGVFIANGSEVLFSVRLPRKRNDSLTIHYFLWDE